jgi:hypothetical protein
MSIPKIIHYCWFGKNPKSELALKCIESWKRYCPDYEIIEWNEDNFDICYCDYVREAYEAKKWAFVSDVARLYALVNYGGIYMDTDVEVIKSLDRFLIHQGFSGFEDLENIPTGIMAAEKDHPMFRKLLEYYDDRPFVVDGELDLTTNVTTITNMLQPEGFQPNNTYQEVAGIALYPYDYFCPRDIHTLKLVVTENTYTIHHFAGSWLPKEDVERQNYKRRKNWLEQKFGLRMANIYESLYYSDKKRGGNGVIRFVCGMIKRKLF